MSAASLPVPGSPSDHRPQTTPVTPSTLQRVMGIVAWVMVPAVPAWVAFGHGLLNGGVGWLIFIHFFAVIPIGTALALTHAILVTVYGRRVMQVSAPPKASIAALAFTIAAFVYPFCQFDGGDSGPEYLARLHVWFGLPRDLVGGLGSLLLIVMLVTAILAVVFDIIELRALPRPAPRYAEMFRR